MQGRRVWSIINFTINNNINIGINININIGSIFGSIVVVLEVNLNYVGGGVCVDSSPDHLSRDSDDPPSHHCGLKSRPSLTDHPSHHRLTLRVITDRPSESSLTDPPSHP